MDGDGRTARVDRSDGTKLTERSRTAQSALIAKRKEGRKELGRKEKEEKERKEGRKRRRGERRDRSVEAPLDSRILPISRFRLRAGVRRDEGGPHGNDVGRPEIDRPAGEKDTDGIGEKEDVPIAADELVDEGRNESTPGSSVNDVIDRRKRRETSSV